MRQVQDTALQNTPTGLLPAELAAALGRAPTASMESRNPYHDAEIDALIAEEFAAEKRAASAASAEWWERTAYQGPDCPHRWFDPRVCPLCREGSPAL